MAARSLPLLACLAGPLLAACSEAPTPTSRPPNVVIFLIDTLRADWLHAYGFPQPTSPHIDALSWRGVLFEQASAAAPWTLPSVASLMTSTFAPEHDLVYDGKQLDPALPTLAELLRGQGYRTAAFYHSPYVGGVSGLDRGFEVSRRSDDDVPIGWVRSWLAGIGEEPFLLYVHNTEPHDVFLARDDLVRRFGAVDDETRRRFGERAKRYRQLTRWDFARDQPLGSTDNTRRQRRALRELDALREPFRSLYSASVLEADERVGELVATLEAAGRWDRTLFVLTSDHGEEMGEHGGWLHDQSAYEELIRVPLLLRLPGDAHAGRRIGAPVSLVDVLPTVLDAIGRPELAPGARGRSLLPLLDAGAPAPEPRVTAVRQNEKKFFRPFKEERGDLNVVVREGPWKAIWNAERATRGRVELYDLSRDPGEALDRAEEEPERAARLGALAARRYREYREAAVDASEIDLESLDPGTRRALEALGYLDASEESGAPDPAGERSLPEGENSSGPPERHM